MAGGAPEGSGRTIALEGDQIVTAYSRIANIAGWSRPASRFRS